MYLDRLTLTNVRTFVKNELQFNHPDTDFDQPQQTSDGLKVMPKPALPSVNLLLGDNGSGKTTVLQAIALSTLGPVAGDSQLPHRKYVRFHKEGETKKSSPNSATMVANLRLHEQDGPVGETIESQIDIQAIREIEQVRFRGVNDIDFAKSLWLPVFSSQNEAFFCAAYGATRRVESGDTSEMGSGRRSSFLRGQRLQSIFQDSFALFPLQHWLPSLEHGDLHRYQQVVDLLNTLLEPGHYRFSGELKETEYWFRRGSLSVPFRSLSDGYRAFVAWVADLLYHICYGCPPGKDLTESAGIVLVDEIDLHLHPKWQMEVVSTVAKTLPRMQFVFSSHSPLVASSLEWMNIVTLRADEQTNLTTTERLRESIHGLDADQVLLTEFFGLSTTRAPGKVSELEALQQRARHGDEEAAKKLVLAMSRGTEGAQ